MLLDTSAVILAGESSKGFSDDKGIMLIDNKALIRHVFDIVTCVVDEVIIVTNTQKQADQYAKLLPKAVNFVINDNQAQNCLSGVIAGLEAAQGVYALLLPYDAPLINKELAQFLIDLARGKTAVVSRTSDNEIEPLCAVYHVKTVLEIAKQATSIEGVTDLQLLVEKLRGARYISMSVIEQIDPKLCSFFRVKTPLDLKRAAVMLQGKQGQHIKRQKK